MNTTGAAPFNSSISRERTKPAVSISFAKHASWAVLQEAISSSRWPSTPTSALEPNVWNMSSSLTKDRESPISKASPCVMRVTISTICICVMRLSSVPWRSMWTSTGRLGVRPSSISTANTWVCSISVNVVMRITSIPTTADWKILT